jgi:thiamine pyrophosphate-dependent acetolactate synthase large subunit-like protein
LDLTGISYAFPWDVTDALIDALKSAFDSGKPLILRIRIDPDEVPAGAMERFETLAKKHPG